MANKLQTLNCRGKLLSLSTPLVMGILNVTPDSFYSGSRERDVRAIVDRAGEMLSKGADILDVGGMSTRPGAKEIPWEEEAERVVPVIAALRKAFPKAILSVDTYRPEVAAESIQVGVDIINDVTGGQYHPEIYEIAAKGRLPYVMMHMRGKPDNMKELATYDNLIGEIMAELLKRLRMARSAGLEQIIIDPGFGFAKNIPQNFELLSSLRVFGVLGFPILVGISRKSMIYRTLGKPVDEALTGTIALNMAALERGANILRVHDVEAARDTVIIHEAMKSASAW